MNDRIRRVGPDGVITTVAGNPHRPLDGDGGPATQARLDAPTGVALAPDGSFYIADSFNHRIRRVGPDGIISTVPGNGSRGFGGDGGPARAATLGLPTGVALAPDGSLYIADGGRIRRVGPDGIITTVAGRDSGGFAPDGDGGPATAARFHSITGIARAADGTLYIADEGGPVGASGRTASLQPSRETGRRRRPASAPHQASPWHPMAASTSWLAASSASVGSYPAWPSVIDPKGHGDHFVYDATGRLVRNTNAGQGGWTIARTEEGRAYTASMTSAEGRTSSFKVEPLAIGDRRQVNTAPEGTVMTKLFKTNGEETTTAPDDTVTTVLEGPDPRFGRQAPYRGRQR